MKISNRIVATKGGKKVIVTLYGEVSKDRLNAEYILARERAEMFDGYDRYLKRRSEDIAEGEKREAAFNMQAISRGYFGPEAVDIFEEYENE